MNGPPTDPNLIASFLDRSHSTSRPGSSRKLVRRSLQTTGFAAGRVPWRAGDPQRDTVQDGRMPGQNAVLVIAATRPWSCANCGTAAELGEFLHMEDAGPLCLDCADLGHLEFLPRGDAALTRRARAASRLSAVVVQWSRTRKRYERQGILAEPEAIVHAESECLADSGVRERRRALDAERRAAADEGDGDRMACRAPRKRPDRADPLRP